jgi:hypothetical protein
MRLNTAKTESILFTQSRIMREQMEANKITFNGKTLEWLPSVKYLGVILDSKLLMKQNIENNVTKARIATGILYPLLKKNSTVPLHSKFTLCRSYIWPILTYACPVFANSLGWSWQFFQIFSQQFFQIFRCRFSDFVEAEKMRNNFRFADIQKFRILVCISVAIE